MDPRELNMESFDYPLPDHRIARYPLEQRDQAKLLVWKNGHIIDSSFRSLGSFLRSDDRIVLNETRVIPARIIFNRESGARIEVFCLEPLDMDYQASLGAAAPVRWKCLIGNAKKWKQGEQLHRTCTIGDIPVHLIASRTGDLQEMIVEFKWSGEGVVFSEVLDILGELPLPPYFGREAEESDRDRYQTVFARQEGSVAAPTAGLHFTTEVIDDLISRGVKRSNVLLHVGAGTFRPVTSGQLGGHDMHSEYIEVSDDTLQELMQTLDKGRIIPVGTTCMRTLESLYWIGLSIWQSPPESSQVLHLGQWQPYQGETEISPYQSLQAIREWLAKTGQFTLKATTAIIIAPGYRFRLCAGLITNFHLPKSTLILLVAALTGGEWRSIYEHALNHDYRFLSYGDSSLLLPEE